MSIALICQIPKEHVATLIPFGTIDINIFKGLDKKWYFETDGKTFPKVFNSRGAVFKHINDLYSSMSAWRLHWEI